jgi:hypothetical protein
MLGTLTSSLNKKTRAANLKLAMSKMHNSQQAKCRDWKRKLIAFTDDVDRSVYSMPLCTIQTSLNRSSRIP